MLINRLLKNLCSILPLLGFAAGTNGAEHGLVSNRIINKTTNFSEGESEYAATPYLPEIEVFHPVHFLTHPSQPKSVYIVQQNGIVLVVPDTEQPVKEIFLDIQSIVESEKADFGSPESGLLGMAFHPDYESNGRFFVFYTTEVENEHGETELRDELTEFRRSADDLYSADPDSRRVLISQLDENPIHNAGHLEFGPDGLLYVALGDEGGGYDFYENGQKLDQDFFSGILRLDVDHRADSVEPNPHSAVVGAYWIPADNPWLNDTSYMGKNLDPSKVRTEFYAIGLRNPWRFSFDPETGELYCNDVGQNRREEINKIVPGGNYGWSVKEGTLHGAFPDLEIIENYGDFLLDPWLEYSHQIGSAATGSLFYRGDKFPDLNGSYLLSDYSQGWIFQIRQPDKAEEPELAGLFWNQGVASLAYNPQTEDIILVNRKKSHLEKLVVNKNFERFDPPGRLSETGLFADLKELEPETGVIPYQINVPFWSDGAIKSRWFALTDPEKGISWESDITGKWAFPDGTFWVKHFDLETVVGDPDSRIRIETRVLVQPRQGIANGFTYRWEEGGEDAILVKDQGEKVKFEIYDPATNKSRQQEWYYPSRSDCLRCHNAKSGWALGFNARQLNQPISESNYGTEVNQLSLLSDRGFFEEPIVSEEWRRISPLARLGDESVDLHYRIRSYLDVNCAYCHQPDGAGRGTWDGRLKMSFPETGLLNDTLMDALNDPDNQLLKPGDSFHSVILQRIKSLSDIRMPPLGSNQQDVQAIKQMSRWIHTLGSERSFSEWWAGYGDEEAGQQGLEDPYSVVNEDTDADGWTNWMEYKFDTDPLDKDSFWSPRLVLKDHATPRLEFVQPAGVAVWVERLENNADSQSELFWEPAPLPGNKITYPAYPVPRMFPLNLISDSEIYRVRVRVP